MNSTALRALGKGANAGTMQRAQALAKTALGIHADPSRPVVAVDLVDIVRKHERWTQLLPRVKPFYAVKCNNDDVIVGALAHLGTGFDCASQGEIEQITSMGVDPSRVIYANPCKAETHIEAARDMDVKTMTFDNMDELDKIKAICPDAKLLLRLLPNDEHSLCRLGEKYGADIDTVPRLLRRCAELSLDVRGFSYHVGSGCYSSDAFTDALDLSRAAFDIAANQGLSVDMLDIGGGFPGEAEDDVQEGKPHFDAIAAKISTKLDALFPESTGVQVIGEPGRYYAHSSCTLASRIIARRVTSDEAPIMYYISDGVYGAFNSIMYDHAAPEPCVLDGSALRKETRLRPSSVWGPTCDGLDCVNRDIKLPEMQVGDELYYPNMGAYTISAGSRFNGFEGPVMMYFGIDTSKPLFQGGMIDADNADAISSAAVAAYASA